MRSVVCLAIVGAITISSSGASAAPPYGQGLRLNLDDKGDFYVRFLTWHQVWNRYMELNPGTEIQGEPATSSFDIALRRSRFLVMASLGERLLILTHFGVDNQVFNGARKPQLFMHDAWVQYEVLQRYLAVGFGLHYWHGVSRMTNASTLNLVPLDAPVLNWPTIERTDQFARFLGIFAKGKVGPLDYRVALNKPFSAGTSTQAMAATPDVADYDPAARTVNMEGYLQYQLWDEESDTLPYAVGTYLGGKRVLNLGAGFHVQPAGMVSFDASGQEQKHDLVLLGLDVFIDTPVGDYGAITAYGVYYHYDFGPNHLRSIGIMNPGSGGTSVNGAGNAFPVIGTGEHFYGLVGYLVPRRWTFGLAVQPYVTGTVSLFQALEQPSVVAEAGVNLLLEEHHAKLTAHYRNRPIFSWDGEGSRLSARADEFIVQAMVFL